MPYTPVSSSGNTSDSTIQKRKTPTSGQKNDAHHLMMSSSTSSSDDEDHHRAGGRRGPTSSPPGYVFEASPFKNWGARHTLTLLGFLGFASSYSMRVNLSIAIVSMVNSTEPPHNATHLTACPNLVAADHGVTGSDAHYRQHPTSSRYPKFNWSGHEQGIILGSFFYGYVATQVPGGLIADRIGGKWVFGFGMLTTALFSLVTPIAAEAGFYWLVAVRVIQGLGEGVTNPSMHALLAQWIPPPERSMLGAFVYAGTQIGTVVALPLSGLLIGNEDPNAGLLTSGWPSVFYVFGLLGIVWFVIWSVYVYDSPSLHPRISIEELAYIQQGSSVLPKKSLGHGSSGMSQQNRIRRPTPWRRMLTSPPVLAILVAQTGHGWGLYTMLTELPTYMKDVLHFDIKQNAYLSALPYFLMWIVSVACSIQADRLRARGVSTGFVRKVFNTIAHWVPAGLLVLAANTACDRTLTVTLITLAISINGAAWASFTVNHIDISPNNAAVMMGITNGFANLCGIAAPYVAGVIINEGSSVSRWRIIFYIAAVIYFIDNVVYILLASGETQPWDSGSHQHGSGSGSSSSNNNTRDRVFRSGDRVTVAEASSRGRPLGIGGHMSVRINGEDEDDRSPLLEP